MCVTDLISDTHASNYTVCLTLQFDYKLDSYTVQGQVFANFYAKLIILAIKCECGVCKHANDDQFIMPV